MDTQASKNRIWEIDALRGLLIPGMIAIHLIYDVVDLYGFVDWPYPAWYALFKGNYGAMFVFVSGISVTLGSRSLRRGAQVFLCGMVISAVTWGMYLLGMAGRGIIIYFGVLHCLGVCMMLWPIFSRWRSGWLAAASAVLIAAGLWLRSNLVLDVPALVFLGFRFPGFASSDYFPLMPNLGYFLLGAVTGRHLYRDKTSLLPNFPHENPIIRCLCWAGRNSLTIYMLHQPVLAGLCELWERIRKL